MRQRIQELFSLQELLVEKVSVEETAIIVVARSPRLRALCPRCGQSSSRLHQRRTRTVTHGVFEGKPVRLTMRSRRFLCRQCCRPFTESLSGINRKRTSHHGRREIVRHLARQSFHQTAGEFGVDPATIRRTLIDHHRHQTIPWAVQGSPIRLGIDEHSFRGHDMALTVTNLTTKTLLTILSDDRQETLRQFLRSIPREARGNIHEVCMDMKAGFRTIIADELPTARIVVDHFHVIAAVNDAIDQIRQVLFSGRDWQPKIRKLLFKNREDLTPKEHGTLIQVFEH